jgi:hypothetical protein
VGIIMMKKYKIKSEYYDYWGADDSTSIVTYEEIERLAYEWDCSIEELLDQVDNIYLGGE